MYFQPLHILFEKLKVVSFFAGLIIAIQASVLQSGHLNYTFTPYANLTTFDMIPHNISSKMATNSCPFQLLSHAVSCYICFFLFLCHFIISVSWAVTLANTHHSLLTQPVRLSGSQSQLTAAFFVMSHATLSFFFQYDHPRC